MSDQELKPLPKGLLKTVAYTQLCEAIKKDFGIELPMKSGEETTRAVEEMLDIRIPDPTLEELAGALKRASKVGLFCTRDQKWLDGIVEKYQQSKVKP